MIKNYIKTSVQNILKHRFFAVINLLGLTIGIAGSLLIALYISDEFSFDNFHTEKDRMYRIILDGKLGSQEIISPDVPTKIGRTLTNEVAAVDKATIFKDWGSTSLLYKDKKFIETEAFVADSMFLEVFTFPLTHGDNNTALDKPNSIVLTKSLATKYFGDEDPMGKMMVVDGDEKTFKVTGVMEDVPVNSHFNFTALISYNTFPRDYDQAWINNNTMCYFLLNENAKISQVDEQLENIIQKYISPAFKQFMGSTINEFREHGDRFNYYSQALSDIHLFAKLKDDVAPQGDISYIYILLAIGLFIIVIACINFMNLSTAKSANRAKEVGLRKTMGATRKQLIGQFLTESLLYSFAAAILSLLVVYLLMPYFNVLSGKSLFMGSLFQPIMITVTVAIVIIVGVLAGSYPAFYLTSFEVMQVLKGKMNAGSKSKSIRGVLVTFQFWISIVLIISTTIIYRQMEYTQNKKTGIDKDQIVYIKSTWRLRNDRAAFKNKIDAMPEVMGSSYTSSRFPGTSNNSVYKTEGDEKDYLLSSYHADYDHQNAMGFELVKGRFFDEKFKTDTAAVLINEAAIREMGMDNPLEKKMIEMDQNGKKNYYNIIGVIKDFNFESLKQEIRPMMIFLTKTSGSLAIRFKGKDYQKVLTNAGSEWDKMVPNEPFEYTFLSDEYDKMFREEQRLKQMFSSFTILAIFIACLGLFGLTAFTAEQRTKEIGIRKSLGASVWQINTLLSKEFTKLVIIAFVLAVYPTYYLMSGWLENFAYRIEMGVWVFFMGGIISLLIAWLTVSFQAQKAARANPMKALKYE